MLGGHVAGPAIGPGGLAGHVVVLEFWGVNSPPCIASMPGLEELHRTLRPRGLVIVGAHARGGTAAELRRAVSELGVTFTVVENATVDGGMDFNGIPHCVVFDHAGKCVYRGSPGGAHDVVAAAVRAGQQLARLEALESAARSQPGGATPQVRSLARELARTIERGWPGSAAAARAEAIAEGLGTAAESR